MYTSTVGTERTDKGVGSTPSDSDDNPRRQNVISATIYVVVGFGLSQLIRLAGNLVLTRLLFPELFGFMALAQVFITGLHMFSDVGLEPGIVRSKRANDVVFLNTAWTLQVVRGAALAVLSFAIAQPAAVIYDQPLLRLLIPAIGLANIPRDLSSTSIAILNRELRQKLLVHMELTIQVVSLFCTVLFAYFYRNVWSLVVGQLVGSVMRMIWSHRINPNRPHRLTLERAAVSELLTFGKWVFVSTAMTFLAAQTDRLMLGRLLPIALFGIYGIALMLATLPQQVIARLSSRIIFPVVAKLSQLPRSEMRSRVQRPRALLLLCAAVLVAVSASFGDFLVLALYDERYSAAAWIFPILVVGIWPVLLTSSIDGTLYAIGKPVYSALGNLAKVAYLAILLPLSYQHAGALGAVVVVALDDVPVWILTNIGLSKQKLSLVRQDVWATGILICGVAVLLTLRELGGLGFPWSGAISPPE